jgi:hypothetical protein
MIHTRDRIPATVPSWRFHLLGWLRINRSGLRHIVLAMPAVGVWQLKPSEITVDVLATLDPDLQRWRTWFPRRGYAHAGIDRAAAVSFLVQESLAAGELTREDIERLEREWRPRPRQQGGAG